MNKLRVYDFWVYKPKEEILSKLKELGKIVSEQESSYRTTISIRSKEHEQCMKLFEEYDQIKELHIWK